MICASRAGRWCCLRNSPASARNSSVMRCTSGLLLNMVAGMIHATLLSLSTREIRLYHITCRKKGPLACHAERERSIWSHQAGGVAHLGFFAALRMTCPGHFFMACHEKNALPCHAERAAHLMTHHPRAWNPSHPVRAQHL